MTLSYKAKGSIESRSSTTTLAMDTDLVVNVEAGKSYSIEAHILAEGGTDGEFKYGITVTGTGNQVFWLEPATESTLHDKDGVNTFDFSVLGQDYLFVLTGMTLPLPNDGTLGVQWAQNVSHGTATSLLPGSCIKVWEDATPEGTLEAVLVYTSSGTFEKANYPAFTSAEVHCIGGGGGGGGGADFASGTWGSGGGGGGAGGHSTSTFAFSALGTSETITIGSGGGGANKNLDGIDGGDTTFGSGGTLVTGGGGSGGIKGNATATGGAGGAGGSGDTAGGAGGTGGIAQDGHGTAPTAGSAPGGGGGGAGLSNTQAPSTNNYDHSGSDGGASNGLAGGVGATYSGTHPSPGLSFVDAGAGTAAAIVSSSTIYQGSGGGGGVAAQDSVLDVPTAEDGAAGGWPGGGGGGGGGERDSTNTGGTGGAGADGVCVIILS